MDKALKSASPIHLYDKMPKADCYIFQCECDKLVNKEKHSDVFVSMMKKTLYIEYHTVPKRGHCDLTDEMIEKFNQCICESIEKHI